MQNWKSLVVHVQGPESVFIKARGITCVSTAILKENNQEEEPPRMISCHPMPCRAQSVVIAKGKNAAPIQSDLFACRSFRIFLPNNICTTCSTSPSNFRHSSLLAFGGAVLIHYLHSWSHPIVAALPPHVRIAQAKGAPLAARLEPLLREGSGADVRELALAI